MTEIRKQQEEQRDVALGRAKSLDAHVETMHMMMEDPLCSKAQMRTHRKLRTVKVQELNKLTAYQENYDEFVCFMDFFYGQNLDDEP